MTESGAAEPTWLPRLAVELIHRNVVREHGGSHGLRDEELLDSALSRPRTRWAYRQEDADLAELAASYAHGIVKNHPFVDGNERVALMAAYAFLAMNGRTLDAPEPETVAVVVALSAGELSEDELAAWTRRHL